MTGGWIKLYSCLLFILFIIYFRISFYIRYLNRYLFFQIDLWCKTACSFSFYLFQNLLLLKPDILFNCFSTISIWKYYNCRFNTLIHIALPIRRRHYYNTRKSLFWKSIYTIIIIFAKHPKIESCCFITLVWIIFYSWLKLHLNRRFTQNHMKLELYNSFSKFFKVNRWYLIFKEI